MQKKLTKKTVLIMGAGVAGLASALELTKAGFKVTVIERESQVGGLASTIQKGRFRFDTGGHRWYAKNDETNQWMLNLMKGELIKVPRLSRIYFDGKFIYWPIRLGSLLIYPIWKAAWASVDYLIVILKNKIKDRQTITLEDGYVKKFGRTLYGMFFKRYSEKLWGRSCSELSSDWIDQRTRGFNIGTVLKELILRKNDVVSFVDEFYYPKFGIGRIAEKMAEQVKKNGGKIILNASVKELKISQNQVKEVQVQVAGKTRKFKAAEFISSIPLPYLIGILSPKAPESIKKLAQKLEFRSEVQVALFLKKSQLTPDTWIYVYPEEIPFVRMTETDNWSKEMSPKGTTSYVFELPCELNDETWRSPDKVLAQTVAKIFIQEFHYISAKDILGWHVHRIENLLPVYHIGYKDDLAKIKKYLKTFTNLQIVGRNGIFRYNNSDHSIEMGFYAARNIISDNKNAFDIESVGVEREYVEEKRIRQERKNQK